MSDQKGFTLIEVMVAIMLMAVVSVIAWRGLDSVTRADQHLQASSEQTEVLLRALNQMQLDVNLRAGVELGPPIGEDAPKPGGLAAVSVRSSDSKGFSAGGDPECAGSWGWVAAGAVVAQGRHAVPGSCTGAGSVSAAGAPGCGGGAWAGQGFAGAGLGQGVAAVEWESAG